MGRLQSRLREGGGTAAAQRTCQAGRPVCAVVAAVCRRAAVVEEAEGEVSAPLGKLCGVEARGAGCSELSQQQQQQGSRLRGSRVRRSAG
jgi:hypothetical protein